MTEAGAGQTIVITGATRGIGRALAESYVGMGHRVLGCGRSAKLVSELAGRHGPGHSFAAVDVCDERAVAAWAEAMVTRHGAPDLLINNAAVINRTASLWEVPAEEADAVIDVNVKGVMRVLRHFVPAMVARGRGVIVNLSSGWGRSTSPGVGPYCASKWAIEGLTRALAQELPPGLAAIPLSPGVVDTEMLRTCQPVLAQHTAGPEVWAATAAPFILGLGPRDSGQSVSVP